MENKFSEERQFLNHFNLLLHFNQKRCRRENEPFHSPSEIRSTKVNTEIDNFEK